MILSVIEFVEILSLIKSMIKCKKKSKGPLNRFGDYYY